MPRDQLEESGKERRVSALRRQSVVVVPHAVKCICALNYRKCTSEMCPMHSIEYVNSLPIDRPKLACIPAEASIKSFPPFTVGEEVIVLGSLPPRSPLMKGTEKSRGKIIRDEAYMKDGTFTIQTPDGTIYDGISSMRLESMNRSEIVPEYVDKLIHKMGRAGASLHVCELSIATPTEMTQEQLGKMLEQYSKLIDLKYLTPINMAIVFSRRSAIFAALGRYQEALNDAESAIQQHPHLTKAYFRQGVALASLGKYTEATIAFRNGLKIDASKCDGSLVQQEHDRRSTRRATIDPQSPTEKKESPAMLELPSSPGIKTHMLDNDQFGHHGGTSAPHSHVVDFNMAMDMAPTPTNSSDRHIVQMIERIPRFILGAAYTRNSFFAKKLLLYGIFLFTVQVTGFAYYYEADNTDFDVSDIPVDGCPNWTLFPNLVFMSAPLVFVLFLPATGIRIFELFSRKKPQHFDPNAKVKFRVTRTWYLQFCEVVASLLLLYCFLIFLTLLGTILGPDTFKCTRIAPIIYGLVGFCSYIGILRYVGVFTRFREHIKMQLGAFKESNQTGDVRSHLARMKSAKSSIRKRLYRAAERCNTDEINDVLSEAKALLGPNYVKSMYSSTNMYLGFWSFSHKNPLHVAASLGDLTSLARLCEEGFDINALDKVSRVRFSTSDLFWFFARHVVTRPWVAIESDMHSKATLMTPLHCAVATSQVETVRWLVEVKKADVNVMTKSPFRADRLPPLFLAEHPKIVEILLTAGANHLAVPDPGYINCITALELAYLRENYAVCSVLEDWGSDIALTPMHVAAATGDIQRLKHFLKMHVDPNCLGEQGYIGVKCRTPMHWAAINGEWQSVSVLLNGGADPDFQDSQGRSPLHWAVRNNKYDVVNVLLKHGCSIDLLDKKGMTPIICAAFAESVDVKMLKLLVSNGADINYQMKSNGDTALHIAIKHEKQDTAVALVGCGANIMATNHAGYRAIDIATSTSLQFAIKSAAGYRDVMISYTHSHSEFALKLRKALEDANITAWLDTMDPSGIGGGSVWRAEIAKGITNATLLVAIVTDDYTRSDWCLKELACAKNAGTPILPISTENARLTEEMQVYLYTRQIVPFEPAIKAINNTNPRNVTYEYDDNAFQLQFRLLLDGIRDEVEKKRKKALRTLKSMKSVMFQSNPNLLTSMRSPPSTPVNQPMQSLFSQKFVFIAHGDFHWTFVKRLHYELTTNKKVPCYLDNKIADVRARVQAAKEAILHCACVVVVLSAKSCKNEMLNDQLAFAEDKGKPIYPVILHTDFTSLPPNQLYSLSRAPMHHFALELGFATSFDQLFGDLSKHVDFQNEDDE